LRPKTEFVDLDSIPSEREKLPEVARSDCPFAVLLRLGCLPLSIYRNPRDPTSRRPALGQCTTPRHRAWTAMQQSPTSRGVALPQRRRCLWWDSAARGDTEHGRQCNKAQRGGVPLCPRTLGVPTLGGTLPSRVAATLIVPWNHESGFHPNSLSFQVVPCACDEPIHRVSGTKRQQAHSHSNSFPFRVIRCAGNEPIHRRCLRHAR
jgi:hypothetical protein